MSQAGWWSASPDIRNAHLPWEGLVTGGGRPAVAHPTDLGSPATEVLGGETSCEAEQTKESGWG